MKQTDGKCSSARETFTGVLAELRRSPGELLIDRWNWKSAVFSSLCRGAVFLLVNLNAGWDAATGAMIAEFTYRACTAGFSGALTQAFRNAEPRWAAAVFIPISSHVLEFAIHWLRGTPNLRASIIASSIFTIISTLFNLHAMRRGILVVGKGSQSLVADLCEVPMAIFTFVKSGFGLFPVRSQEPGECA